MITITIKNSNAGQLSGDRSELKELYEKFRVKHPNAWYMTSKITRKGTHKWDGYINYISKYGAFKLGLLAAVYRKACEISDEVHIVDMRTPLGLKPDIPKKVGELTLRPEQYQAVQQLLSHQVGGIPFYICCANLAVNFGKTLLFATIHKAFKSKLRTILLLSDSDLFEQFRTEIPKLLPDEKITFIRGGKVTKWSNFNVAMVQSLAANLKTYGDYLAQVQITLIDEADQIDNKTYKTVLERLYNTQVRIGLSGTLYKGRLKKDFIPNTNKRCFIGEMVEDIKLSTQIGRGASTPLKIKWIELRYLKKYKEAPDYPSEYKQMISSNIEAFVHILHRVVIAVKKKRTPVLVATKYIEQTENLANFLAKSTELQGLVIKPFHHKIKNREQVLQEFREGKIDILVASTIIARGKNAPLTQTLVNAASLDSEEFAVQLIGRMVRMHQGKEMAYVDDLVFPGQYLSRHGKHRKLHYQAEGLKVIKLKRKTPYKLYQQELKYKIK